MFKGIYHSLTERKRMHKKSFAVLIDPDKVNDSNMDELVSLAVDAGVDYFFVGGSLVISNYLQCTPQLSKIKVNSADMDELEMHPYLNRKQSEFIINYRRQHRTIKDLNELKSTGFFKKEELAKIEPYLAFD